MPDLLLDVAGSIRAESDPDLHRFSLIYTETRPHEFLEIKVFHVLERLFGLVKHLDPVQGKDPYVIPYVAIPFFFFIVPL